MTIGIRVTPQPVTEGRRRTVATRPAFAAADAAAAPGEHGSAVTIERLDRSSAQSVLRCAEFLTRSFATPGAPLQDDELRAHLRANVDQLSHPDAVAFVAMLDQGPAGVGFVDVEGPCAAVWGGAVAPEHRRRGIQSLLLRERLRHAAEHKVSIVSVETDSGGSTHRNAARIGFRLAYSRAVLGRPFRP